MKISIFGMGYVGAVSGACLAEIGHEVLGVDISEHKVDMIRRGIPPIVEESIADITQEQVSNGRLQATTDTESAIRETAVSFISVGTPSAPNGALSLKAVDAVVDQIGAAIAKKDDHHTVVLRSTVLPGTTEDRVAERLERASGRKIGENLSLGFNPEFLREGSSVKDFHNPPFTIIGSIDEKGYEVMEEIYRKIQAPIFRTTCRVAESIKYLSNVYHAVKIAFANEAGALLKSVGVDGREAMQIFMEDTQLNISKAYLRPGYAFGGSCLPKDLRAFLSLAQEQDINLPFLRNLLPSNERHIDRAFDMVTKNGRGKVAIFGLTFKPGTDDLRESPMVTLVERLLGRGYDIDIFDRNVELGRLVGANKDFIEREIPHLEKLLSSDAETMSKEADVIVIGHIDKGDQDTIKPFISGKRVIDLQGADSLKEGAPSEYEGICW